jgi:hypothetical protein
MDDSKYSEWWALLGLLLWTPVVLGVIAGLAYLFGHVIFGLF